MSPSVPTRCLRVRSALTPRYWRRWFPNSATGSGADADADEGLSAMRLVKAIAAFVRAAAGPRSAVLLLEDLHWVEEASAVALRHLVRGTEGARLLVLVTYRPHRGRA